MTNTQTYDGSGKLGEAIAGLCGFSQKSQAQIAKRIKEAKAGLGISSKSKKLPNNEKLAIWQWHYNRLHLPNETVEINSHNESVEINSQADDVEILSHDGQLEPIETISQTGQGDIVEIITQPIETESVETFSQETSNEAVEINSPYDIQDVVRIAFYTTNKGIKKRQVIALDGFYINALMLATGIKKQAVPKWVQQAVVGWRPFDRQLPVTRQVKFLLIRELTTHIKKLTDDKNSSKTENTKLNT